MQINSMNRLNNQVQFKGEDNKPGKNNLAALSSLFVFPGVGEKLNDQPNANKRLALGVGTIGLAVVSYIAAFRSDKLATVVKDAAKQAKLSKAIKIAGFAGAAAGYIGHIALRFKSSIDAYRYDTDNKIGKNTVPGLVSFLTLPGVGEKMNGQPNANKRLLEGFSLMGLVAASGIAMSKLRITEHKLAIKSMDPEIFNSAKGPELTRKLKLKQGAAISIYALSALAMLGLKIKSGVDAYKYNTDK
jgi:hypothetical protein